MKIGTGIIWLLCIGAALAVDAVVFDWDMSLALARRFAGLLSWMAFWR